MKKKVLSLILVLILAASMFSGCSKKTTETTDSNEQTTASTEETTTSTEESTVETETTEDNGELVNIFWQYPAPGEVSEGIYDMENALNEMLEKDIGVHVTFVPTTLDGALQDATLMVSAGEQLDVCMSWGSLGQYVEKGLIVPIDDLLEKTGVAPMLAENNADPYSQVSYDGKTYGVPAGNVLYRVLSYNMKKTIAEKYNLVPDDNKVYTLDEMEAIFKTINDGEGKDIVCQIPWGNTNEPLNYNFGEYDLFGGDMSLGALMLNRGFDTTEIVNIFETPEYADYAARMYDWAKKGWISPDAAVTTDTVADIVNRDNVAGYFGWGAPDSSMLENSEVKDGIVQFKIVDGYVPSTAAFFSWNIPITSVNPEKALEAIAYIYQHKEAAWLIQFGIEGVSYNIVSSDGDKVVAKYAAEDVSDLPYYNVYGLWGNRLQWPTFGDTSPELNSKKAAYQKEVESKGRVTPSAGYVFKSADVSIEIAAVQTVMAQYCMGINSGALDPIKVLPEFIAALKAAGIDDVIAENQKQFDAWRAQQ